MYKTVIFQVRKSIRISFSCSLRELLLSLHVFIRPRSFIKCMLQGTNSCPRLISHAWPSSSGQTLLSWGNFQVQHDCKSCSAFKRNTWNSRGIPEKLTSVEMDFDPKIWLCLRISKRILYIVEIWRKANFQTPIKPRVWFEICMSFRIPSSHM